MRSGRWAVAPDPRRRDDPRRRPDHHEWHCALRLRTPCAGNRAKRRTIVANRWQGDIQQQHRPSALVYSQTQHLSRSRPRDLALSAPRFCFLCAASPSSKTNPPSAPTTPTRSPPRLRGRRLREPARGDGGVSHAAARPRAGRHRSRRRDRRRLRAVPRAARAVGDAADHLPVGARFGLRHRRRAAPRRRRLPDQGREPAAPRRAHRGAVPPQRAASRRRRRPRTCCRAAACYARPQAPDGDVARRSASTSR